jgi:hypothetical protein
MLQKVSSGGPDVVVEFERELKEVLGIGGDVCRDRRFGALADL